MFKPTIPRPIPPESLRKIAVWAKGSPIPGYDPKIWRRDRYDWAMKYDDYGRTDSEYGWQIDHIIPEAHGGSYDIENLQPLHWRNNQRKSDHLTVDSLLSSLLNKK